VKNDNEKKAKKKRKKSNQKENVQVEGKEAAEKDSVPKPDDGNKSGMDVDEEHQGKLSNENAVFFLSIHWSICFFCLHFISYSLVTLGGVIHNS